MFSVAFFPGLCGQAFAQESAILQVQNLGSFGRIILTFPDRYDLPAHTLKSENGVLIVDLEEPISLVLPDVSGILPDFVSAARIDPDGSGIRIGLKGEFKVNKTEAGESLYIDILSANWKGIEPGLPREVVEELSRRAHEAAAIAEQKRKAELARLNKPTAIARVGRHPTFVRLIIDWSIDVEGEYEFGENKGLLSFDWPVPVDLYALKVDLPAEIVEIANEADETGSRIHFKTVPGVVPRFYATSSRQYVIDFDLLNDAQKDVDIVSLLPEGNPSADQGQAEHADAGAEPAAGEMAVNVPEPTSPVHVTPFVDKVGSTIRIVFPFEEETAAAVFRRGDVLWMIFDTRASISKPEESKDFAEIAKEFSVVPSGETSIVRINLSSARLATLGSEGRSWVLSLGDVVLAPAELIALKRRQTREGLFEMTADLLRPAKVHQVRDPEVGDILEVVTAFPPARGIIRDLSYVDFSALRSIHGLVVQPWHEDVAVRIEEKSAIISAGKGLVLSAQQEARDDGGFGLPGQENGQGGFVDLSSLVERDMGRVYQRQEELMQKASQSERRLLDSARLELARFYLANQLPAEALGVLEVTQQDLTITSLAGEVEAARAAATTVVGHYDEALKLLASDALAQKPDTLMWRTIAAVGARDFEEARKNALAAEPVIDKYPSWVREKFLLSAMEAAIEQNDVSLATRFLGLVETSDLDLEMISRYELLAGRLDEAAGRLSEALDTYGQVIAGDIRPTRAEAIYRTLQLLDRMQRLDPTRAADTLASEVVTWRGGALEAKMMKFLAELQFRNGAFRDAFETVESLSKTHSKAGETEAVLDLAKTQFANLYLNGEADSLPAIDALTLYYDFRTLTPAGTRGDEMVRNLARRLIKVDLLEQAAELLQYQIDSRLEGAARAQIAADLAVVYLANRSPQKALKVLGDTRITGIPEALERQRRILEARAFVDAHRQDLALDLLSKLDGRDADLLRVDAHWRAKRYREASEILEKLYSSQTEKLSQPARLNIVKAAVGYVLDDDRIGITRLRERFATQMAETPEWSLFNFVTGEVSITSREFRQVAKEVAGEDSLNAFLQSYRETYGVEGALAPEQASKQGQSNQAAPLAPPVTPAEPVATAADAAPAEQVQTAEPAQQQVAPEAQTDAAAPADPAAPGEAAAAPAAGASEQAQ